MGNGNYSERLPQESERREDGDSCILESASAVAHRVLEEIEALAGTAACKAVQLVRLKNLYFIDTIIYLLKDVSMIINQKPVPVIYVIPLFLIP